ncbi:DUF6479 family protein [Streptomyces goshikiensis]|uniref:DUF6479 family protein n=1 Tax=Streptomyces goshikiensis TaxID=1942 RepID=UPI0036C00654
MGFCERGGRGADSLHDHLPLAADGSSSLFLIIAGVVVVVLMIGACWCGSRRAARRTPHGSKRPSGRSEPARGNPAGLLAKTPEEGPDHHNRP